VTAITAGLRCKSGIAVVTEATLLTGINFVHGNFDAALLHFRKQIWIMTVCAFVTGLSVNLAGKLNLPLGTLFVENRLVSGHSHGCSYSTESQQTEQQHGFFHRIYPLAKLVREIEVKKYSDKA
jgi:hypothetical protein